MKVKYGISNVNSLKISDIFLLLIFIKTIVNLFFNAKIAKAKLDSANKVWIHLDFEGKIIVFYKGSLILHLGLFILNIKTFFFLIRSRLCIDRVGKGREPDARVKEAVSPQKNQILFHFR